MCKTYQIPKTDSEIERSMISPVNPAQYVKTEDLPVDDLEWEELYLQIRLYQYEKKCPFGCRTFKSEHAYQLHLQKHKPQCTDCKIKLKSWKDYSKHLKFCRQKSNTINLPIRPEIKKQPKLKWKCQLCKRRYKTEKDMRSHQINRCEKRYLSNGWIVKI